MYITRLQSADAAQYRALMLQAYALAPDAFTSTADERAGEPLAFWVHRIANPAGMSVAFGAFDGPTLVGTVALELSAKPKTSHKGHVIGMFVVPASQGSGTGFETFGPEPQAILTPSGFKAKVHMWLPLAVNAVL